MCRHVRRAPCATIPSGRRCDLSKMPACSVASAAQPVPRKSSRWCLGSISAPQERPLPHPQGGRAVLLHTLRQAIRRQKQHRARGGEARRQALDVYGLAKQARRHQDVRRLPRRLCRRAGLRILRRAKSRPFAPRTTICVSSEAQVPADREANDSSCRRPGAGADRLTAGSLRRRRGRSPAFPLRAVSASQRS